MKTKGTAPSGSPDTNGGNAGDTVVPSGKHIKFLESKAEREEFSPRDESSEEEELQIHGEDGVSTQEAVNSTSTQSQKKRKTMDVFAGACVVYQIMGHDTYFPVPPSQAMMPVSQKLLKL